jgi:hypothetical protein
MAWLDLRVMPADGDGARLVESLVADHGSVMASPAFVTRSPRPHMDVGGGAMQ